MLQRSERRRRLENSPLPRAVARASSSLPRVSLRDSSNGAGARITCDGGESESASEATMA
ncbi:hypothetical protein BJX65DRAFT_281440 [Aspergillus insuetus]